MLYFQRRLLGLFLLTLGIAATSCRTQEQGTTTLAGQDRAADEAAIRAGVAASEAAINGRDFAALAAQFVPDGDAIVVSSPKSTGPEAIRRTFETGWADAPADRQISITVDSIRFLTADIAVVDMSARFSAGEPTQDRATSIVVRRDGAWRTATLRVLPAAAQ